MPRLQRRHFAPSLLTRAERGLAPAISFKTHFAINVANSLLAASAPWLFSFSENKRARIISPIVADRVNNSSYAKLVSGNAMRVVAGIFNRQSDLLEDVRIRQSLNYAIDRERLVEEDSQGLRRAVRRINAALADEPVKPFIALQMRRGTG